MYIFFINDAFQCALYNQSVDQKITQQTNQALQSNNQAFQSTNQAF